MVDHVRKIVESNNDLAPRAENPAKLSYRVLWIRQKIKDESDQITSKLTSAIFNSRKSPGSNDKLARRP